MGNQYGRNVYQQRAKKIFAAASRYFKDIRVTLWVYRAVIHSFSPTAPFKEQLYRLRPIDDNCASEIIFRSIKAENNQQLINLFF
jgi:hypothetical protein